MMTEQKTLTFLIVDDDIPLSLFFKKTLLQDGHRVFVAVNEHGALEFLKNEAVDIMICDLMLPGLDGSQIIRIVKEHHHSLFCVLISGYHNQIISKSIDLSNADMVIMKPIFRQTFDSIIQQYFLKHPEKQNTL